MCEMTGVKSKAGGGMGCSRLGMILYLSGQADGGGARYRGSVEQWQKGIDAEGAAMDRHELENGGWAQGSVQNRTNSGVVFLRGSIGRGAGGVRLVARWARVMGAKRGRRLDSDTQTRHGAIQSSAQ